MKPNDKREFLEFAKELSKSSGKIPIRDFRKGTKYKKKKDGTLVTATDVKSEKYIIREIRKRYPDHKIFAEESGILNGNSEYMWVIDPLDGTHNFINGIPLFAVSIGLARNEEMIAGAIYFPFFGWLCYATKGGGAFMNGKRIHVSGRCEDEAFALHDSYFIGKREIQLRSIERLTNVVKYMRMFGAATMNFVSIASGMADVYVERTAKSYDIAAGCLLVEEAGGVITEISGRPWSLWSENLIVSNGKFHKKVIEILSK